MNTNEVSRYQQFRQFRTENRGSSDYPVIGIDVAKDKHYAFVQPPKLWIRPPPTNSGLRPKDIPFLT